jgi:hypothetical protein
MFQRRLHTRTHWSDGGATSLSNCLLLCSWHHRLVHEGGWRVEWWGTGRPVFVDPRGGTHFDGRWTAPEVSESNVAASLGEAVEVEVVYQPIKVRSDWRMGPPFT